MKPSLGKYTRTLHRKCQNLQLNCISPYSALAEQFKKATEGVRHPFRTKQSDPLLHTHQHEGLFYTVPADDGAKFFVKGQTRHFPKMVKSFNETAVMVRKPALQIFSYLNQCNYNFPVIRCVLYGKRGCGKTVTLSHVMHQCSTRGWLVVHIPWGSIFTKFHKDYQLSSSRPGRVDVPVDSAEWLSYFKTINSSFIKQHQPTVQGSYTWTKREKAEAGTTWQEIIEFALGRPKYASDIIGVLVKEIKLQTNQKKFQTLFAVDGVNAFFDDQTVIKREEDPLHRYLPEEISVIHNFKKLLRNDWTNGAVVCTVDNQAVWVIDKDAYLPRHLLGKEGFEYLDPFLPVQVLPYSDKEVHSCLEYYLDRQWIINPKGATKEGKEELIFLSVSNPFRLYDICGMW